MLDLMKELGRRGVSFLLSSHLLPDVEQVCERVIVLGRGRVLAEGVIEEMRRPSDWECTVRFSRGTVEEFKSRLAAARVECLSEEDDGRLALKLPAAGRHDLVLRAAAESATQLRELRPKRSSLEEMFLKAIESQHSTRAEPADSPDENGAQNAHPT